MGNMTKYAGLVTKIRAMQARLLKDSHYEEIANLSSVPQMVSYLKEKTVYGPVLEPIDEAHMHRGDLEKIMTLTLYHDYSKIYRFANLEVRKMLKLYLRSFEVALINYCLRIVINNYQEPFDINYRQPFFDKYSSISIAKLIRSKSLAELIENLKDSEYYPCLKALENRKSQGTPSLFDYDLSLTLYCYSAAWKTRSKLIKAKDKQAFINEWGSKIDLLNLEWVYRAKKYYQMEAAHIYAIIIPNHYLISAAQIKSIVEAANQEECLKAIASTKYGRHFTPGQEQTLEQLYPRILQDLYRTNHHKNPYSLATIHNYLYLKTEELSKLTTAMECLRYSLSSSETLAYIKAVGGN